MSTASKRIVIVGAPTGCWTNAGDEAILAAMVNELRDASAVDITVVSSNPEGYLGRYGVKETPYHDIAQIVSTVRASDLMILGGGSIFFDYCGFDPGKILLRNHEGLAFVTGYALLATLVNKPLMIYAVGVGPLQSTIGKTFTRVAFEQAQVVTVRDPGSKVMLESLGVDTTRVQVTADPVFTFDAAYASPTHNILDKETSADLSRPFIAVALREWGIDISSDQWEPAVADALDRFLAQHGGTILFVPFHRTVDWPLTDDLGVAERVSGRMQHRERPIIVRREYEPEEKAALLASCDLVLGMRLHSLIFALNARVPMVALNCDPKVQNLMSYTGQTEWSISLDELTSERLATTLEQVFRNRSRLRDLLDGRHSVLAGLARQNAALAAGLLIENVQPSRPPISQSTLDLLKGLESSGVLRANGLQASMDSIAAETGARDDQSREPRAEEFQSRTSLDGFLPSPSDLARSLTEAEQNCKQHNSSTAGNYARAATSTRPRVACLTNRLLDWETRQPHFGGAERYALTLGRLLRDLGFDIEFYQAGNYAFEGDYFGFKVFALAPGRWVSEFACGVSDAFYEASADYDHIIYLMPNFASGRVREDALLICHDVWFDHNYSQQPISYRTAEWFEHLYRVFSQPKKIVSADTNSINVIRVLWPELAGRMTYLPNWVDTKSFHPPERRDPATLTVLFPRRSEIVRGAGILGAILEGIPHDCRFRWWVGEGTAEGTELVKAAARRDPRLEFYAVPSFDDMPRIYQEADICVIPTLASEATSLACLEGLASGCAMVATNVGGLPNLIQPGVNGLLVDPQPQQIAAAINYLIEEPVERDRLQCAGRQTALAFDLEVWRRRWTTLLNQLGWISGLASTQSMEESFEPMRKKQDIVQYQMPATEQVKKVDGEIEGELFNRADLYDVICFSIIAWEFRYQRPQQIMSQFADQGHRVFYVDIFKHLPVGDKRYEIAQLRDNVWEVTLATTQPVDFYGGKLPADVARFFVEDLRALRDEFDITRAVSVVQFATWATTAYAARHSFGWPIIYDCMDNWSTFPGMETMENVLAQERKLVASADLLVVSSQTLWEKWSSVNTNSVFARNAADFKHFNNPAPNALLTDEPRPIVGYFGAIAEWFDIDLMTRLAKERPGYTFVLLGDAYRVAMDELQSLPNVQVLGVKPYEEMPAYLLHFDVCIVPFTINEATEAMDVVKFYEYISQGKPVVATRIKELLPYEGYLYLADDADDFIRKVDLAALENDANLKEKRIELARLNTWQARLKIIKAGIEHARRKVMTTEMLKILVDLLQEEPDQKSKAESEKWLLKRVVSHLNASLAEREQVVQIMNSRLTDREYKLNALSAELESRDKLVAARDEAITWLKGELAVAQKDRADLVESNESLMVEGRRLVLAEAGLAERERQVQLLSAHLKGTQDAVESLSANNAEREKQVQALSAQLNIRQGAVESLSANNAEREKQVQALSAQLNIRQGAVESLSDELASQQERVIALVTKIAQKDQAIEHVSKLLEDKARIILARDEAIAWLKGEWNESQAKNTRLIGSSNFLKMQLAKNEAAIQSLGQHLSERDLELGRITRSLGWRLLSRYGPIKYRYLLPLYRMLNLLPAETRVSPGQAASTSLPARVTVDETPSGEEPAIEGPAVEESERIEYRAQRMEGTGDSEEAEQFDFYESVTLLPRLLHEEVDAILDKRPPAEPLYRQDVVCFSIIDWETRYQRPQQIMSQFAGHGHRVFYISTTRFLSPDAAPRVTVKQIKENVYEVQLAAQRIPDVYGEVIDGDNKEALLDSLDELRRTHRINDAIGYTMIASWGAVALEAKRLWGWRTIYDCMDEWENFPGIKRGILDMEQQLVRDCDLLVVTAQRLWGKWESYERAMVLARNGVDMDFYDAHYHPNSVLSDIKQPVIGYYGAIADWFDLDLVAHSAKARPEYTFVLLGGVFEMDVSDLKSLPNVRLLGQQPYETMPQYLYHFDVCMIPFKINPITEATDPVKLYEYLSAGKPVVSVALSEVEDYAEYLYIARDRDDFVAKLDAAVAEDDREMVLRRRKFAEQHTWKQRYKTIEAGITLVTPRVSIIIVSYNNLVLNKLCLESVIRNTEYPNYEIIVVDNASKDGTPAYLRYMNAQFPHISIILNDGNNGFARANNQGIARSSGDYIVLLNNDTIVPPGWLSRLLRHLENSEVGMIGPLTNFVGNEAKLDVDYQTWGEMEAFAARHVWEHDGESADIYMLAMFCVAFKRDTYDEIGPLDEQFGLGMFEDDDYAQRMKAKGYRVMCAADAFVHHFGQAAFKKLIEDGRYNPLFDENRSYYETKWNVEWVPHVHKRLKFERLPHAALERQAVGKKR